MFGREIITFNILNDIDEIKPNETNIYENIEINRFDGEFCSNTKYEIKIKCDLINKDTSELNYMLYYSLNQYRSVEKDNFKKISELFLMIPKIESFNNKIFISNSTIATELE